MTLSQILQRVYAIVGNDVNRKRMYFTDADIIQLVNQGIRLVCLVGKCYQRAYTATLLNTQSAYTIGSSPLTSMSDCIDVITVYNTASGVALNQISPKDAGKVFLITDDPMWWYVIGNVFNILPAPVTGTGKLGWTLVYNALSADVGSGAEIPSLDQQYHMALVDFAVGQIYNRLGNAALGQFYMQQFAMVTNVGQEAFKQAFLEKTEVQK